MKDLPSEFDGQSIRQLKFSLDKEGSQLVKSRHQSKMLAADGKQRETNLRRENRNKLIDFLSGIHVKAQLEFDPRSRLVVNFRLHTLLLCHRVQEPPSAALAFSGFIIMTRRRVIAYVDGFNFYYRRLRNQPYRWLDLVALFENLFPNDDVIAVKYFTAQVTGKFDANKPLRQQAYLRALGTLPKLHIVMGQFLTTKVNYRLVEPITDAKGQRIESVSVWRPEEKGSDGNLGSHLLNDAWNDSFDVAAVLTNDSDLTAPVRLSAARGKTILIIHPDNNSAKSLIQNATGSLHLHDKHLRDAQLPEVVELASGKSVRKPGGF